MHETEDIQVNRESIDDGIILRPAGEIDLSKAPSLRHQISEAQNENPQRLVISLEEVPYMDSSGVATLVEAMQIARKHGSKLILCALQDKVLSIFEIARLDMVFTIVDSADDALTA